MLLVIRYNYVQHGMEEREAQVHRNVSDKNKSLKMAAHRHITLK